MPHILDNGVEVVRHGNTVALHSATGAVVALTDRSVDELHDLVGSCLSPNQTERSLNVLVANANMLLAVIDEIVRRVEMPVGLAIQLDDKSKQLKQTIAKARAAESASQNDSDGS